MTNSTLQQMGRLKAAGDIRLEAAPVPAPGPRDVLIRIVTSGICGTDLSFFKSGSAPSGAVLGHEFSGMIEAAGSEVAGVAAGMRVTVNPMTCGIGLGRIAGSFAQFLLLTDAEIGKNLFPLPARISNDVGALVEPFAVGLHAVSRAAVNRSDKAVIFGAGPVGLCVLTALRVRGLDQVLVIDPSPLRRDAAQRMGAMAVHDPRDGPSPDFIAGYFGQEVVSFARRPMAQANIAFDCAGIASVLEDSLHALAIGGRLVLVADPHKLALPDLRLVMQRELSVLGAVGYGEEFGQAVELAASGTVDLAPMITHRFPLDQLADAFAMQSNAGAAIKVLVDSLPLLDR